MRAIGEFYFKDCTPTLFTRIFPPNTIFPKKFTVLMSQYIQTIGNIEQFAVAGYYYSGTSMQLFQVARSSYSSDLAITINYTSGSRTLYIPGVFDVGQNNIYVYVDYTAYPTCYFHVVSQTTDISMATNLDAGKSFYNHISFVGAGVSGRSVYLPSTPQFKCVVALEELPVDWSLLETSPTDVVKYIKSRPDAKDIIASFYTTQKDDNVDAFFSDPTMTTDVIFENSVVVPAIFVNEGELVQVGDIVVQTENPQLYVKTKDVQNFIARGLKVVVNNEEFEVAYYQDEAGITKIELRRK